MVRTKTDLENKKKGELLGRNIYVGRSGSFRSSGGKRRGGGGSGTTATVTENSSSQEEENGHKPSVDELNAAIERILARNGASMDWQDVCAELEDQNPKWIIHDRRVAKYVKRQHSQTQKLMVGSRSLTSVPETGTAPNVPLLTPWNIFFRNSSSPRVASPPFYNNKKHRSGSTSSLRRQRSSSGSVALQPNPAKEIPIVVSTTTTATKPNSDEDSSAPIAITTTNKEEAQQVVAQLDPAAIVVVQPDPAVYLDENRGEKEMVGCLWCGPETDLL